MKIKSESEISCHIRDFFRKIAKGGQNRDFC